MGFEPTEWYLGKVLPYHLATPACDLDYMTWVFRCQVRRNSYLDGVRNSILSLWYNFSELDRLRIDAQRSNDWHLILLTGS